MQAVNQSKLLGRETSLNHMTFETRFHRVTFPLTKTEVLERRVLELGRSYSQDHGGMPIPRLCICFARRLSYTVCLGHHVHIE